MLNQQPYYNRTIRKIVTIFGTLFNGIEIVRFDKNNTPKERIKVPLVYGPKEKYITRIATDPTLNKSILAYVPRIAFNLDSIEYDSSRKLTTTTRNFSMVDGMSYAQFNPVPYNYDFSLSIFVRNTEDGTQILEQILPFFTPDFTISANFIPTLDRTFDIPITLNSVTSNIDYEGDMSTVRVITWDLNFIVKGYLWPTVKSLGGNGANGDLNGLIRKVITNIHATNRPHANTNSYHIDTLTITPDPIDADPDDDYGFTEIWTHNEQT